MRSEAEIREEIERLTVLQNKAKRLYVISSLGAQITALQWVLREENGL